jgi:Fur family ferric uptake transcriptional regulator
MGVIRKTKSIEILLAEFDKVKSAISTITLVDRLSSVINKTTVYRVLDRLEDEGVLHSFLGKDGIRWFAKCSGCSKDKHQDTHPHFQCLICGTVDCFNVDISIPIPPKREVTRCQILLQGTCENCL